MGNLRIFANISLLLSLIALYTQNVQGYSGGADPSVCDSMKPGHGADSQTSPSPYTVTMSKNAVQGYENVEITISSKNGNDIFKGFLVQVRKVGGDNKAVGEFKDLEDDHTRTLDCFGRKKSAMTHKSSDEKKSVTVHWEAPNDADAEYQVL